MKKVKVLFIVVILIIMSVFICQSYKVQAATSKKKTENNTKSWNKMDNYNIQWSFDKKTKTLEIIGTGEIPGYSPGYRENPLPWMDLEDVRHIILAEGITKIGVAAFSFDGNHTKSIVIPESVVELEFNAFADWYDLESVKLPKKLKKIPWGAFSYTSLKSIELPKKLEEIGESAFESCDLKYVKIPDSVKKIGAAAFMECKELTEIKLPKNLKVIHEAMFCRSTKLDNIEIPESVTKIERDAFNGCASLKHIVIPEKVSYIGVAAFLGCESLTEVKLPTTLQMIRKYSFQDCMNLKSILLPETLTFIGESAFRDTGLTSITIPGNVEELKGDILYGCVDLKQIKVDSNQLKRVNRYVLRGVSPKAELKFPEDLQESYRPLFHRFRMSGNYRGTVWWVNPDNKTLYLRTVGEMGEQDIEDTHPDQDYPWKVWERYVERVVFGNQTTSVGAWTLVGFSRIKTVELPECLEKIGAYAFENSNIKSITIPSNVKELDFNTFERAEKLKTIILKTEKLGDLTELAWGELREGVTIIAPLSQKESYEKMFERTELNKEVEVVYQ